MLLAIVQHTPVWVWGLLAALVAIGLSQTRDREMTLTRITVLPLVLLALSGAGVFSAFGPTPVALGAWLTGLLAALALASRFITVRGAAWHPHTATLRVPGSWLPLALIVALFLLKYAVGVSLALHHEMAQQASFAGGCSLAYGLFSGLFLARARALRSLARQPELATVR